MRSTSFSAARTLALAVGLLLAGGWASFASRAEAADPCRYRLGLRALADARATNVFLAVVPSRAACRTPGTLRQARLKIFSPAGRLLGLRRFAAVPAAGGRASLTLGALRRRTLLRVTVQFGTRAIAATAVVRLRPDLVVVTRATTPRQALAGRPFALQAVVAEVDRDVGAVARLTVLAGASPLASATFRVRAGQRAKVSLPVTLPTVGPNVLVLRVSDASTREGDTSNDDGRVTVEVTELQLARDRVLVPSQAGYGAQFDQNVYAAISRQAGVTDENVVDMEAKVVALEPGLVRVFFNRNAFADPDLMQSFVRTVQLAQRARATINVTWMSGGESDPATAMAQFARVLVDLVRSKGVTGLRWVTVWNEPNSTRVTMDQYEALYRALDRELSAAGLRGQIRFMGGDLLEAASPLGQTQRDWLAFLGTRMADLLDAYSIHVFWDYWDTGKIVRRLTQVRQIVDSLPATGRRPLYVTEFSARGSRSLDGVTYPEPGVYADGTPLARTTINAFQHAWLDVLAAKLGYAGTVKWDGYFGKYDRGTQDYSLVGPPQEGWPLRPVYNLTRLFTLTTRPGWRIVAVDGSAAIGTKLVAGYTGPRGQVTVVGLDTSGAQLTTASPTTVSYSIGGLPANASFQLSYWNADGSGQTAAAGALRSDGAGVLTVTAPLQSVFAVTAAA